MKTHLDSLVNSFSDNVNGVKKLISFDRDVLDIAIIGIRELSERLKKLHQLDNPHLNAARTLETLENIRAHDSLRPRYQIIFNQAIVLLVSYFGSSIEDIFRLAISHAIEKEEDSELLKEEIKLTYREMKELQWHLREAAADLLVEKKDLSFQDMQAISRAFRNYLGISLEKDVHVNNIILAQACRHVIVHAGASITDRLLRQVANASPRDIKPKLVRNQMVEFSPEEINAVAESMRTYVNMLSQKVHDRFSNRL